MALLSMSDAVVAVVVVGTTLLLWQIFARRAQNSGTIQPLPPWVTLEIGLFSAAYKSGGPLLKILSFVRRRTGSLWGMTGKHQVVLDFAESDRLLAMPMHTINSQMHQHTMMTRVFGSGTASEALVEKRGAAFKGLLEPVERMFLNDAASVALLEKGNIPNMAASFVSFSNERSQQQRWEHSAKIRVIEPESSTGKGVVEANLMILARDFGACLAVSLLYGSDFLSRNTQLLEDFWKFDDDAFIPLVLGVPTWAPLKAMKEGVEARSRLHQQLQGLYRRVGQHMKGEAVDFDADMSDVSACVKGRYAAYQTFKYTEKETGETDLGLLWGQNANTQPMVFWFLAHAYSIPGLLDELRKETAPYLAFAEDTNVPSLSSIDISALSRECPLTKSCLFEVYRLANDATSIRYVGKPLSLKDGEHVHNVQAGTWLSTPHGVNQRNPAVYKDPESFKPDRFLVTDESTGKRTAKYGSLKPWGGGQGICKGRTFAEKEIICLVVSIMALWDIVPASGEWKMPAMLPGTGAMRPAEEIRVRISRRQM